MSKTTALINSPLKLFKNVRYPRLGEYSGKVLPDICSFLMFLQPLSEGSSSERWISHIFRATKSVLTLEIALPISLVCTEQAYRCIMHSN